MTLSYLAALIKDKSIKVKISELVERNDALNKKVVLVNEYLSKICKTIGLPIIKHHNINPEFHLNQSKPHLNKKYNTIFMSNFRRYLNNFNWRKLVGDELTVYSGKIKSFEYPNNKSANDQSVSHNISELKNIRLKNVNNIIIPQININSIRNKFELLSHYVSGDIDILIITETKLDKSFPNGQFFLHGYSEPFRLDSNQFGGGLLTFVREDITVVF